MDFGLTGVLLRLGLGLAIGFCIGLTGVGGGALIMPSLTLVLRLPPTVAVGTASLYAFLTKIYATHRHFRLGTIDFDLSLRLLVGAVPANIVVSLLINRYVNDLRAAGNTTAMAHFQSGLRHLIAGVILVSAVILLTQLFTMSRNKKGRDKPLLAERIGRRPRLRKILAVVMGAVVGALIGSTSIGGGVLIVPILIIVFGLRPSRTVGSSIFIAVILTLVTSAIYLGGKSIDLPTALLTAAGSLGGVYWGSKLSVRTPERLLQGIVATAILVAAALMFLQGGH